jgi:hypothetical protein
VKVRREVSSTVEQSVCIGDVRREAVKALSEIRADCNKALAFADPGEFHCFAPSRQGA